MGIAWEPSHQDRPNNQATSLNSITLNSNGVIPVAILSSETFDATTVDPGAVSLGGGAVKRVGKKGKLLAHAEDVNADGLLDLVCQVVTEFVNVPGDFIVVLEAETFDGNKIRAADTIRVVPD